MNSSVLFLIFLLASCRTDQRHDHRDKVTWGQLPGKKLHSWDTCINFKPFRKLNVLDDEGVIVVSNVPYREFTRLVLRSCSDRYDDRSTYVIDLNKVVDQYKKFKTFAPNVEVHYAIKANSDPYLSYILANLGASFDCASKSEIEAVLDGLHVDPSRIIFANTAKSTESIQYAADKGVQLTIFDNVSELDKIAESDGDFKLLIRLLAVVEKAGVPFSDKFGAMMDEVPCLLRQAKERGLDVIGVHFHLGLSLTSTEPFDEYIRNSKIVFDIGKRLGFKMSVLDIGGGFTDYPDAPVITLEETMATVNRSLAQVFRGQKVRLLAEPGRFFAALPVDLYVTVINRRWPHDTEEAQMVYYVNEPATGQLTIFSHLPYEKVEPYFVSDNINVPFENCPPSNRSVHSRDRFESIIYGPSCHPGDRYQHNPILPMLNIGDTIRFVAKGAYSASDSNLFNGFQRPRVFYTIKPKYEHLLHCNGKRECQVHDVMSSSIAFIILLLSAYEADLKLKEDPDANWRQLPVKKLHGNETGINFKPFSSLNILDHNDVIYVSNQTIEQFTSMVLKNNGDKYDDRSTFVVDLNKVVDQYNKFKALAPDVEVHYAMKANSDPYLLHILASLGSGFDCASRAEIEAVIYGLKVDPSRIIFANTAKSPQSIEYAVDKGVTLTIFDDVSELDKLAHSKGNFKLLIRLLAVVKNARVPFSDKFGAKMDDVPCLLAKAKEKGLDVIGVHFHLGLGLPDTKSFDDYVAKAKTVFDMGQKMGFNMSVLDIGGGFVDNPNDPGPTLAATLDTVSKAVARVFKGQKLRVIAEPGRYLAAAPFDLYANVVNRRPPRDTEKADMVYYINEPHTGQLNTISYLANEAIEAFMVGHDTAEPSAQCPPSSQSAKARDKYASLIYGPSCYRNDVYPETPSLPLLNLGDKVKFVAKGAYSIANSNQFNGFQRPRVFYTIKPEHTHLLK
ncbi:Ornithine decarboxylase [Halotydeus destructor]|nr:Ornithine decarboxylase [Halotydeus destructor]